MTFKSYFRSWSRKRREELRRGRIKEEKSIRETRAREAAMWPWQRREERRRRMRNRDLFLYVDVSTGVRFIVHRGTTVPRVR